jgi:hypothetical protein
MVLPFLLPCIFSILHYVLTLMAIAIAGTRLLKTYGAVERDRRDCSFGGHAWLIARATDSGIALTPMLPFG